MSRAKLLKPPFNLLMGRVRSQLCNLVHCLKTVFHMLILKAADCCNSKLVGYGLMKSI